MIKRTAAAAVMALSGLGLTAGLASPAGAATEPQAHISVPNYTIWNMRDIGICGTLTNPSAVGDGGAAWDMATSQNQSAQGSWYLYQADPRDCGPTFTPGDESIDQPLGQWHAYPDSGGSYQATPFGENTATFWIEEGSWAGVKVIRSGHWVGVSAWARYYDDRLDYGTRGAAENWTGHRVDLQRYVNGAWRTIATRTVGENGSTSTFWLDNWSAQYYRAYAPSTGTIVSATSARVWR